MMTRRTRVHLFYRKPVAGDHFSIERLFDSLAPQFDESLFDVRRLVCPFRSTGLVQRIAAIIWGALHQGDVNHITGDVHFLGLLMGRRRTVLTVHDSASMQRLKGLRRHVYRFFWLTLPLRHAARITLISHHTLAETLELLSTRTASKVQGKMHVIPNCVTAGIQSDYKPEMPAIPRVLVVGTKPNKNLNRIIHALEGLSCLLVIIGALSPYAHERLTAAKVTFENLQNISDAEIAEQYQLCDLVLFVPTYEGFGLPILEAQAAKRPVVTSRRKPMCDVAGPGACLADPENVAEIRSAIERILFDRNYRLQLVQSGVENITRYSPRRVAAQYAKIYAELGQS